MVCFWFFLHTVCLCTFVGVCFWFFLHTVCLCTFVGVLILLRSSWNLPVIIFPNLFFASCLNSYPIVFNRIIFYLSTPNFIVIPRLSSTSFLCRRFCHCHCMSCHACPERESVLKRIFSPSFQPESLYRLSFFFTFVDGLLFLFLLSCWLTKKLEVVEMAAIKRTPNTAWKKTRKVVVEGEVEEEEEEEVVPRDSGMAESRKRPNPVR